MAARAIWKGIIRFEDVAVPVKLYSAIEDRNIRFRLLHRKDRQPISQQLVNPDTDSVVPYGETQRVYRTDEGAEVLITGAELDDVKPAPSRDIEISHFLPREAIDHRWYDRPYYLGPDGDHDAYGSLARALADSDQEGLAHWVMRNKEYFGALRLYQGYPMLMSLRFREQVISVSELQAPKGKPLDKRELDMARQLIGMLEAEFEPQDYQDEYRDRVMKMIERKRKGGRVKPPPKRRKKSSDNIADALEASLRGAGHGQKAAKAKKRQ